MTHRLITLLIIMTYSTYGQGLTNLIGKPIDTINTIERFSELPHSGNPKIKNTYNSYDTYDFHGQTTERLIINTDDNNIIKKVTFSFPFPSNENVFFNTLIDIYGKPTYIYCINNLEEGPITDIGNGMTAQKVSGFFKDCSYKDDPYLVIWSIDNIFIEMIRKEHTKNFRAIKIHISKEGILYKKTQSLLKN